LQNCIFSQTPALYLIKSFGDKLRTERLKQNLSQEKLAELVGVARNYIGMVERAECSVSLKHLFKIAKALDIKLKELMDL
jgi:transcriptional regulator with XRE-family HTH domain